jgi:ABC-2 type transport system permease protein
MTSATAQRARSRMHRPSGARMNLWRLEWLRLRRTPRALALAAVFVFFGLLEPVLTRYQSQIFRHVGNGVRISFPPATPAQGVSGYLGELNGTGLIVVVVIAAGAFTFDTRRGLAIFLRTRITGLWQLIAPRFTVNAAAAALAFVLGMIAAWYETDLLIGAPPAGRMLAGMLCGAVYLAYAVAVTAFAAALVRGTLATAGIALAVLLLLPIAGVYHPVSNWLPSALANAPADLLGGTHQLAHYLPAFAVTVVVTGAALAGAVLRLRARET